MSGDTALDAFRAETRAWLAQACPPSMRQPAGEGDNYPGGRNAKFQSADQESWFRAALERGYTAPDWPTEYGGAGLSAVETRILREEMAAINARVPLHSFGISMLGPVLLRFGNEAQKQRFLPEIVRGEIRWCQGYSEPGSGSDLASLQTRCEDKGDHWLVNGQKVWTSYADQSDWIFCLVRTDPAAPKHKGISFLLFDMQTPGVSTKPIKLISGKSPFCETFFDDVKVPKDQLIGEINRGWDIAKALLGHERTMITSTSVRNATPLGPMLADRIGRDEAGKLDDPILRARVASYDLDLLAFTAMTERFTDLSKAGTAHPALPSMMKYAGTERTKLRNELTVAGLGRDGLDWALTDATGRSPTADWLRSKATSIEGGTSEIQLNIIAKRILELPDA